MMMDSTDITGAFCEVLRLYCASAADEGNPDDVSELVSALDDMAAYCSTECSRALQRKEAREGGAQLSDAETSKRWWDRCAPGWDDAYERLTAAIRKLAISNPDNIPVACLVEADLSLEIIECPNCGKTSGVNEKMQFTCECGTTGAIDIQVRLKGEGKEDDSRREEG